MLVGYGNFLAQKFERLGLQLLEQMLEMISNINLCNLKNDSMVWEPERNGIFTVKYWYKCLLSSSYEMGSGMSFVWLDVAPPKVETLVWLINRARLCLKD